MQQNIFFFPQCCPKPIKQEWNWKNNKGGESDFLLRLSRGHDLCTTFLGPSCEEFSFGWTFETLRVPPLKVTALCVSTLGSVLLPDLLWHWQDDFSWKKVSSSLRIFPALEVSFPLSLTCQRCRPPSGLKRMLKCCTLQREPGPAAVQWLSTQVGKGGEADILPTRPKVQTADLFWSGLERIEMPFLVLVQDQENRCWVFYWLGLNVEGEANKVEHFSFLYLVQIKEISPTSIDVIGRSCVLRKRASEQQREFFFLISPKRCMCDCLVNLEIFLGRKQETISIKYFCFFFEN